MEPIKLGLQNKEGANMHEITNHADFQKRAIRHGEVVIVPVEQLPANVEQIYDGKEYVVGHSETGHHHVAVGDITIFRPVGADSQNLFMRVNKASVIEHKKSFDRHETKQLFKGLYSVTLKKAYDYYAKRMREVKD